MNLSWTVTGAGIVEMAHLQLQWDLSRNSATVLSVAQGMVRASTHDNVQILALLACERFGATLAICPETRRKVEHQVLKVQTPITSIIDFLGATVGYSSDDCASQMAQSLAGVNFLSLAATIVPGIGAYEGGKILALMLENSAADKRFLPTERHLKDLLSALEYRSVQLGFSNLVAGWQKLLSHAPQCSETGRGFYRVEYRTTRLLAKDWISWSTPSGSSVGLEMFRQSQLQLINVRRGLLLSRNGAWESLLQFSGAMARLYSSNWPAGSPSLFNPNSTPLSLRW